MKHLITGCQPYTATIEIQEIEGNKCLITTFDSDGEISASLDVEQLHSFIGILLHLQQKIKNKR